MPARMCAEHEHTGSHGEANQRNKRISEADRVQVFAVRVANEGVDAVERGEKFRQDFFGIERGARG